VKGIYLRTVSIHIPFFFFTPLFQTLKKHPFYKDAFPITDSACPFLYKLSSFIFFTAGNTDDYITYDYNDRYNHERLNKWLGIGIYIAPVGRKLIT
jgi:hypothetical protein